MIKKELNVLSMILLVGFLYLTFQQGPVSGEDVPLGAFDRFGKQRVIAEIEDDSFQTSAFGELSTAEATPIVQLQFPYNINTDLITTTTNNLGDVSQNQAMAVLDTGATSTSMAQRIVTGKLKLNNWSSFCC